MQKSNQGNTRPYCQIYVLCGVFISNEQSEYFIYIEIRHKMQGCLLFTALDTLLVLIGAFLPPLLPLDYHHLVLRLLLLLAVDNQNSYYDDSKENKDHDSPEHVRVHYIQQATPKLSKAHALPVSALLRTVETR